MADMRLDMLRRALAIRRPDWRLHTIHPLSHRTARLDATAAGHAFSLILQSHSQRDRQLNPRMAADEYHLLGLLHRAGLPVPQPLLLLHEMRPPCLVTAFVDGAPPVPPEHSAAFSERLAEILSRIHNGGLGKAELAFLPQLRHRLSAHLEGADADDFDMRKRLREAQPCLRVNPPVLLHGDFWLGNLLWRGDALAAIVDWEDAMVGDPLADLGKSRLELLWALGEAAMRRYTASYLRRNPALDAAALPFWDLYGASRLGHFASFAADSAAAERMQEQYDRFASHALARLDSLQE